MMTIFKASTNCPTDGLLLITEEWTKGPGIPLAVKGLVWFTDGSRTAEGTEARVYG
jgi:hypothetical protein